jgi:hypothetical protein
MKYILWLGFLFPLNYLLAQGHNFFVYSLDLAQKDSINKYIKKQYQFADLILPSDSFSSGDQVLPSIKLPWNQWVNRGRTVWVFEGYEEKVFQEWWVSEEGKLIFPKKSVLEQLFGNETNTIPNPYIVGNVIVPSTKYGMAFFKAFPKFQRFLGTRLMQIHHRIPQQYRYLFGNEAIDNLSNLIALPTDVHQKFITPMWKSFAQSFPNPTQNQVYKFVKIMDIILEPWANNTNQIVKSVSR